MSSTKSSGSVFTCGWCKNAVRLLTVLSAALLLALPAFSQGNLGRIMGTVTDQSGGVVAGATVTVIDVDRGITRTLTTDDAGEYNAPNLTPGNFTVRAEAKGFKKLERQSVDVGVGKEVRVDLTLQPGEQNQTVTVTEAVPLVETTNATLGGTLDNADIVDMPLNGRNYQLLLGLRPGVMVQPGGGPWTQSTNGVRPDESLWLVDGVINSNFFDGRPILGMPSPITDGATILPVDAIQEFNTMENPKAEYGWKPGAVVNVGLKSGTNQIHGSAYAFGRDQSWDARNAFNPAPEGGACPLGTLTLCDKLPVELKQFGGVVGGPIKKDKLFFFAGYEGLRSLIGNSFTTSGVPEDVSTGDAKHSFVDAINALNAQSPAIPVSTASLKLACPNAVGQALPLPATFECQGGFWPQGQTTTAFLSTFPNVNQSDNGIGKIDYHVNDQNTISGFLGISRYNAIGEDHPYINSIFENGFPISTWTATANWIYTPNSSMVNEVRVGYDRMTISQTSADANVTDPLDTGLTTPGFPTIKIKGFNQFGTQHNRPQVSGPNPYYDFQESISELKGKHSFKFGGEWTHIEGDSNIPDTGRGQFNFNGGQAFGTSTPLEDFLAGTPTQALAFVGNANRVMRWTNTAVFFQDDWRATQKLTVNFGLRYSYDSPVREVNNLWANFDPSSTTGLIQQGAQGTPTMWNPDYKNLSPRIGFAWDVTGKGTTVVRGGFSVMYSTFTAVMWMNQNSFQDTTAASLGANPTGLPLEFCPGGTPCANPTTIPGTAGGIQAAIGSFSKSRLCWDPSLPSCPAGQTTVFPTSSGSPLKCGDGVGSDPAPCNLLAVNPNLKTPYVENYNFGVQHQFGTNLSLEIGYVGNHGARLTSFNEINQPPAGAGYCLNALTAAQAADQCSGSSVPTTYAGWLALAQAGVNGQAAQEARPFFNKFPYFGYINLMSNNDYSYYNSLQTTLTKRLSHGVSFIAGYTYAHGLDNGSLNRFSLLPQDAATGNAAEYGNSDFDVRHRVTLTATYNIPGVKGYGQVLEGWQINAIANIQSSQPWLVNDGSDNFAGTSDNTDRWDFFGNPASFQSTANGIPYCTSNDPTHLLTAGGTCTVTSTITQITGSALSNSSTLWNNCLTQAPTLQKQATLGTIGCFVSANGSGVMTPNALGSFGNMGRNIFRDSGFRGFDFSVFKNFTWKERFSAQFRVEVFNILNHPIYANPYGASSNFNSNNDPSAGGVFGGTCGTPDVCAGNNIVGSGANRDLQLGLKLGF
jgi:hypothetical protein